MTKGEYPKPEPTGLMEHLVFIALLIPTFIVIAAAAVSLAPPDPSLAVQASSMQAVAVCESCLWDDGNQGP
jgi:hypothetical protein